MTTCIRRDHTVWTTCGCDDCRESRRIMRKRATLGHYRRASAAQATVRLLAWERAGYSPEWIASASGLNITYVQHLFTDLRSNGRRNIGPRRSAQILATDITKATTGRCDATGTTRRLQALAWLGYDGATIAAETGLSLMTVSVHQRGTADRINARHWRGVRDFYDRVGLTAGPSKLAANRARRLGWQSPLVWDEGTIDDPRASADTGQEEGPSWEKFTLDDLEDCASWGLTRKQAAERLRVDVSSIEKRCAPDRANRPDLLARLDRNALAREAS